MSSFQIYPIITDSVVKSLRPEIISINAMSESQRLALNIFIYQEFIKELSAICQEHYILENAPELSILNELHTVDSIQYRSSTDLSVC